MRNILTKVDGVDNLTAAEFNDIPDELENMITSAGITLSSSDVNQLAKAIAKYSAGADYYTDGGSANAYVLSPVGSHKAPPAYFEGMRVRFKPANSNTSSSTINVNSLGSKAVKRNGSALASGDLSSTKFVELIYDGTDFQIANAGDYATTVTLPRGLISGLVMSNAADTVNDITVSAGAARDAADAVNITLASSMTKQLDATWAAGTNQGGRPASVSLSTSTWYHVFVIRSSGGTVDVGFDTSLTATNLLSASGYTSYVRVGSVYRNTTPTIVNFVSQELNGGGLLVRYLTPIVDVNSAAQTATTRQTPTLTVPIGIKTLVNCSIQFNYDTSGQGVFYVTSPGVTDLAPTDAINTSTAAPLADMGDQTDNYEIVVRDILTNTSSQIAYRQTLTSGTSGYSIWIGTRGFTDFRR